MSILALHHIAIICSDYARSKQFYTRTLGLTVLAEHYRPERSSYKLDLALLPPGLPVQAGQLGAAQPAVLQIELFSFANPPPRLTGPEACGLRHLALLVSDLAAEIARLAGHGVAAEAVRIDEYTGQRFTFIRDPDNLPIELYEAAST